MSQKPRTGEPARVTPIARVVAEPIAVEAAIPAEPTREPVASTPAPVAAPITPAPITPAPITAAPVTPAPVTIETTPPTPTPVTAQGIATMMKSTEDFVAFNQANLEAFVKSSQIWAAGLQDLSRQFATSAKTSFEETVSTFTAISTAKSVKEAFDAQAAFARVSLEKAMAESNKLTDASIKLTEQTLAPITARVTVAAETFGKAA